MKHVAMAKEILQIAVIANELLKKDPKLLKVDAFNQAKIQFEKENKK